MDIDKENDENDCPIQNEDGTCPDYLAGKCNICSLDFLDWLEKGE